MQRAEHLHGVFTKIRTRKDLFLKFSKLQGHNNKNILSTCLALWRNIQLFSIHKVYGEANKTLMTRTKK